MTFLISKMGLTTFLAQSVSILRGKVWNVMKFKNVMFFNFRVFFLKTYFLRLRHFFSPRLIQSTHFFQSKYVSARFMFLTKHFFSLSNRCYDNSQSVFPLPPWQSFLGKQVISSQVFNLSVQTIREKNEVKQICHFSYT